MFDVLCKDTRYTASTWEVQVNGLTSHLTHRITAEMWILNLVLWPEKLRVCVCVWTTTNYRTNSGFSNQCGSGTAYPFGVPNFVSLQFHQAQVSWFLSLLSLGFPKDFGCVFVCVFPDKSEHWKWCYNFQLCFTAFEGFCGVCVCVCAFSMCFFCVSCVCVCVR